MRRICGFVLFWVAVGIGIGLYLDVNFFSIALIIGLLVIGYNLFCG